MAACIVLFVFGILALLVMFHPPRFLSAQNNRGFSIDEVIAKLHGYGKLTRDDSRPGRPVVWLELHGKRADGHDHGFSREADRIAWANSRRHAG